MHAVRTTRSRPGLTGRPPRHCLSNTGVAFVHGTGNHPDAINDYWSPDFVSSVKQGLPNQSMSIVVNCDFSQYMWTSGRSFTAWPASSIPSSSTTTSPTW
ncbi:hypothetical protein LP420_11065 [Massilia sp. B-10]|nr:hypothetical protein LP420_11065 [Massilia sp. B-10]